MGLLFLQSDMQLNELAEYICKILDIDRIERRLSENVLHGYYYKVILIGMQIKLEYNSYDYEKEYNFMVNIDKDNFTNLDIPEPDIEFFAYFIRNLLNLNTDLKVAIEKNGRLLKAN